MPFTSKTRPAQTTRSLILQGKTNPRLSMRFYSPHIEIGMHAHTLTMKTSDGATSVDGDVAVLNPSKPLMRYKEHRVFSAEVIRHFIYIKKMY